MFEQKSYKAYSNHNFRTIPQVQRYLSEEEQHAIDVVGNVLPFKVNNYVIDELIRWEQVPDDPIFTLTFPRKEMLSPRHYREMDHAIRSGMSKPELKKVAHTIRMELNPHPSGQMEHNVPEFNGVKLTGVQHKYDQTVLFFPSHGQTCHAYCSFCFRWPQFVGMDELKFAMKETELLTGYLKEHPEVTDILFTGGDPMIMNAERLRMYIEPLLEEDIPNLRTIRIGTKALGFWPYRFINDKDSLEVLALFESIIKKGKHLAIMSHFSHYHELQTPAVQEAIRRIRSTGAEIRTQSPVMRYINDDPTIWATMWKEQVRQGCIPYYMFVARDTGARDFFALPLEQCWEIFQQAYQQVSGICRTVRGPSMSAGPGKVQLLGITEIKGEKVFSLQFIQGRHADWVNRPFFAAYNKDAIWLDDLRPAFEEEQFFFETEEVMSYS